MELGKYVVEFIEKWSQVIRAANINQPRSPRIGLVDVGRNAAGANIAAFQKGLAGAGYMEGRNVTIEYRPVVEEAQLPEVAAGRGQRPHHVQRDRIGTWEVSGLAVRCCVSGTVRIGKVRSRSR